MKNNLHIYHRFIDEAGDTTFYGKGKVNIVGQKGVSNIFMLGMVYYNVDLLVLRTELQHLHKKIEIEFAHIPSVKKRIDKGGFYFHAKDDIPEIRHLFFNFIKDLDCSFQAVVARKINSLFVRKHHQQNSEFYADLLSHLLKDKLHKYPRMVINIAERDNSTAIKNLDIGLVKAKERAVKKFDISQKSCKIRFQVHKFHAEPLLVVVDYLCWAVQRVFERGETTYYEACIDKISLVLDVYDKENYAKGKNYYTKKNPLTEKNKVSPQLP